MNFIIVHFGVVLMLILDQVKKKNTEVKKLKCT